MPNLISNDDCKKSFFENPVMFTEKRNFLIDLMDVLLHSGDDIINCFIRYKEDL